MNENQKRNTGLGAAGQPRRSTGSETSNDQESALSLIAELGPHAATTLGLDLDAAGDESLAAWLVASVLLGGRTTEAAGVAAWRSLAEAGLAMPDAIARAGFAPVRARLEESGLAKSDVTAAVLHRVCSALVERHTGSIDALAAGAGGLEHLAHRLSQLGSGFGKAAVMRFLTPLRERWTAANDLPASAASCAAGRHLGWISELQDEEGAPASLARWLACNEVDMDGVPGSSPALRDVEAALDRLGRAACLRERSDRCPLGKRCPRRLAKST
jgi:endonuclease III